MKKHGCTPYEHFEAGGGRINLERIHRFAEVTDSDPYAILAAIAFGSPHFALRAADNKLMTILMVAIQEFDEELGDVITELDGRTLINTFTKAMKELALQSVRRDAAAKAWLKDRVGKLVKPEGGAGRRRSRIRPNPGSKLKIGTLAPMAPSPKPTKSGASAGGSECWGRLRRD